MDNINLGIIPAFFNKIKGLGWFVILLGFVFYIAYSFSSMIWGEDAINSIIESIPNWIKIPIILCALIYAIADIVTICYNSLANKHE